MMDTISQRAARICLLGALGTMVWACGTTRANRQEVTTLINDQLNKSQLVLPVGHVEFISDQAVRNSGTNVDTAKGQALFSQFERYGVREREQVVGIVNIQDTTASGNFSWNNFFDVSQRGVQRKADVASFASVDSRARCSEETIKSVGRSELICISQGSGRVEEIVKSEIFDVGTNQFWFLAGTHRWQWSELEKKIREASKQSIDENRKFMAIAAYDAFAKKWSIKMIDTCAGPESFPLQAAFDRFIASGTNRQPSR